MNLTYYGNNVFKLYIAFQYKMIDNEHKFLFFSARWFTVEHKSLFDAVFVLCFQYKVIDDQHKGLFEGILAVEKSPNDAGTHKKLCAAVSKHFRDEEVGLVFIIPDSNWPLTNVTLSIEY